MTISLSDSELQYLKDLWTDGSQWKRPYRTGKKLVGEMITTVLCPPLEEYVRDKFNQKTGPVGGQLAYLNEALSIHADVLFDLPITHFTQEYPSKTRYVVVDTDATNRMYTMLFEEHVDVTKWTGLKDGTAAIIDYDTNKPTIREQFFDYQIDHFGSNIRDLHIGFDREVPLTIGEGIEWRSNRLHSGCSFTQCGATYKLHLTVLTPEPMVVYSG